MREAPGREPRVQDFTFSSESGCNCLAKFAPENLSFVLCIFTKCSVSEEMVVKKIMLGVNSGVVQNDALEF